jgi:hypothetical protein
MRKHWKSSRTRSYRITMQAEQTQQKAEQTEQKDQESVQPLVPTPGQPSDQGPAVTPAAITVGGTIAATTTIDAIMTSLWATRSADLAATPIYTWAANGPPTLTASWPAATTDTGKVAMIIARFEVRPVAPSTIAP